MTTHLLEDSIDAVLELLQNVDRNDADAMFDCLTEIELLTRDAVSDYSVAELLNIGENQSKETYQLSTAA